MSYKSLVSVVMPVYNGEAYLRESIQSILNQTHKNIEFIIINDASTDSSETILSEFAEIDKRIQVYHNTKNQGVTPSLNRGISLAKGKYIARMDADDISLPQRLSKQVDFLEQKTDYVLVGSPTLIIFGNKTVSKFSLPFYYNYEELCTFALFQCPFAHPSIMARRSIFNTFQYNNNYYKIEDYHLWVQILKKHKATNLNEVLVHYRMHPNQEIQNNKNHQMINLKKLYQKQFKMYGISYTEDDLVSHLLISGSNTTLLEIKDLKKINIWLKKLHLQLSNIDRFNNEYLDSIFKDIWREVCWKGKQHGWATYRLLKTGNFNSKTSIKLSITYIISHSFFSPLHFIYLKFKRGY